MTKREVRKRILLLSLLVVLLALLAYSTYYFIQNRRLPSVDIAAPEAMIDPPQYLFSITGQGASALDRPIGVGVSTDGQTVFVADFGHNRISAFTRNGRYVRSFAKTADGNLQSPVHLAVKGDEVWVTDRRLRNIVIFSTQGAFKKMFEPKNETLDWTPLALTFDSAGALRVTDVDNTSKHQLMIFSEDGSRTATVGKTVQVKSAEESPGGFYFPNGLAVSRRGEIFVSDGDNRRVQVFDEKGEFKRFVDTSGIPRGIAIDAKQRLYAVDAVAHTVDVYDLDGKRLTQFGSQGFGPGQFNYPNDVAVSGARIYVTDRDNNQVQVWGWPVAQPPAVAAPTTPLGWLLCLSPLLLLPLLLLRRRVRIVVTPDFVDSLAAAGEIRAVADRRRLRLVAPEEDLAAYEGKVVDGVTLTELIEFEQYSESDARALVDRLDVAQREAIVVSMAQRARALGTEDRDLRRIGVLADVRVVDVEEFKSMYLGSGKGAKPSPS